MQLHTRASTATWTGLRRPPKVRLGVYEVQGILGEGGMARVYLGVNTLVDRPVAIKRLLPELGDVPGAHALFLREARINGAIRHPNLLEIFDFGYDTEGRPYYVMELACGPTLAERLGFGPMPVWRAVEVAIAVCDAVAAVHAAGFLHRDIKTDNVMLSRGDHGMTPKLIDFGIACRIGEAGEPTEEIAGTPRVMSPEQVARDALDERADIWGIGVLLYEMITSELPFEDMLGTVTDDPLPLPPTVDPALAALVDACLAKDPDERPWGAVALGDQLRDLRCRASWSG